MTYKITNTHTIREHFILLVVIDMVETIIVEVLLNNRGILLSLLNDTKLNLQKIDVLHDL